MVLVLVLGGGVGVNTGTEGVSTRTHTRTQGISARTHTRTHGVSTHTPTRTRESPYLPNPVLRSMFA